MCSWLELGSDIEKDQSCTSITTTNKTILAVLLSMACFVSQLWALVRDASAILFGFVLALSLGCGCLATAVVLVPSVVSLESAVALSSLSVTVLISALVLALVDALLKH